MRAWGPCPEGPWGGVRTDGRRDIRTDKISPAQKSSIVTDRSTDGPSKQIKESRARDLKLFPHSIVLSPLAFHTLIAEQVKQGFPLLLGARQIRGRMMNGGGGV